MSYIKFSQFTPITSISGLSVVGLQGGKNVRIDAASFLSGYLKPTNAGTIGQVLTKTSSGSKWSSKTLQQLASVAGATYDSSTGFFSYNGLTDITESDMASALRWSQPIVGYNYEALFNGFTFLNFRFNICRNTTRAAEPCNCHSMFQSCIYIEVIQLPTPAASSGYDMKVGIGTQMFRECRRLKRITNRMNFESATSTTNMFQNCQLLESLEIINLKSSISFSDSPNLSKESILYMIQNSAATSPITITLHATAYEMANADSEIKTALQNKTNVSLASA